MKTENTSKKVIDTPELSVKDNLFIWNDTIVQIPNISLISASPMERSPFPGWTVIAIALGIYAFKLSGLLAGFLIAAGLGRLYYWYSVNNKRMQEAIMTVQLNSGTSLYIKFKDKKFLSRVTTALKYAISSGKGAKLTVNMKSCTISGNAQVLSNISNK